MGLKRGVGTYPNQPLVGGYVALLHAPVLQMAEHDLDAIAQFVWPRRI
jgi:hypothetical protein